MDKEWHEKVTRRFLFDCEIRRQEREKEEHEKKMEELKKKDMKMMLCVRIDLEMGKGKIAAQCCHSCLGVYRIIRFGDNTTHHKYLKEWELTGEAKIAVKIHSEKELLELEEKAKSLDIPCFYIEDQGRTQIKAGSKTVLAIGPAPNDVLDKITGHLKLL
jgi:PTH2 family peptidyl-tRNA hydrolase